MPNAIGPSELLSILKRRGLSLAWSHDGLVMRGDPKKASESLKACLRRHRLELEKMVPKPKGHRVYRWFDCCGKRWTDYRDESLCLGCGKLIGVLLQ